MHLLFEDLKESVSDWRKQGYQCDDYPLISEILRFQIEDLGLDGEDGEAENELIFKYLREPQFLALEVYWYVRLIAGTPKIEDLYKKYYGDNKEEFFEALGIPVSKDGIRYAEIDQILQDVKDDKDYVKEKQLQALHEALVLDYPSYILALAMGAGKTVLIGAIIAIEFAMSLRYPEANFMKNALVFAPGTTIIESLRELSEIPYEKILPPELEKEFSANLKIEFPQKGRELQAQPNSSYNLIVTNTEKISLRANRKKNQAQHLYEQDELSANLRLQKIASLPNIGIFSDEAHHTYGNTFDKLKRVRQTINYIHEQTPVVAVVNTTGTPYYKKQTLKEVIVWYGLADGIKDNILKDLNDGVHEYDMREKDDATVFENIISEFFGQYGDVELPDGSKAKIAFYFKTQEHLDASRIFIEKSMSKIGEGVSQILVNTQQSSQVEIDDFNRLNNPTSQKRVILLIGKGVEGWNCPSLFACALIKEQTTSSNYILQAATRCLRQISGNHKSAKIFLDYTNSRILNKELQDNFGTSLGRLSTGAIEKKVITLKILKEELPKLEMTRQIKKVIRSEKSKGDLKLVKPTAKKLPPVLKTILTPDFEGTREILVATGETQELPVGKNVLDCYTVAGKISTRYHIPTLPLVKQLRDLYSSGKVPESHIYGLLEQVEGWQSNYELADEEVTEVMALIRIHDENGNPVFEEEGGQYVHHIRMLRRTYERLEQGNLFAYLDKTEDKHDLSFHYDPYVFDSEPEGSLFRKILTNLNMDSRDVETFLFTGGLTDSKKTDFHFEYLGEDGRYHNYFPDFVIVKKTGQFYIVEVKSEIMRGSDTVEAKRTAIEQLQGLQSDPEKFKYHMVYVSPSNDFAQEDLNEIKDWVGASK